jgi:bacteriorhodopsin
MYTNEWNFYTSTFKIVQIPRYMNWILTTPCTLIMMGNIAQINMIDLYFLCILNTIMHLSALFAELTEIYVIKYVMFTFGCFCFIPIAMFIYTDFDYESVSNYFGYYIADRYYRIAQYILSLWLLYPIVWLSYDLNIISYVMMTIVYCIIDVFSKNVFTVLIYYCLLESKYLVKRNSRLHILPRNERHINENEKVEDCDNGMTMIDF